MRTVITGTGSFIPADIKLNKDFTLHDFYDADRRRITGAADDIVRKFEQVTGISARRYADMETNASDMATLAATSAIRDAAIDPEALDQLIVAHNFGNVNKHTIQSDAVPALACRVKQALGIRNPACVAYDLLFGCPGWIQGLIQADAFLRAAVAKRCLVVGAETLSRVIDDYDRDSMIFSDGAGAAVVEALPDDPAGPGILASVAESYAAEGAGYIYMGKSNFPDSDPRIRYLKMQGRKVYEFALKVVPQAMKTCLEASMVELGSLKKIFIHQANEKMDAAIVRAFYQLFGVHKEPELIMPMNIRELGNSSVATVPTLFDMVRKGALPGHSVRPGDVILFASVGAGMNINAVCYRL
jgi:3-oxoacyl-[acyl-carrier-protein] synthase III